MTVSTTTTEVSYTGDGVLSTFPFGFHTDSGGDIDVFIDGVELLVGVVVTLNADQSTNPGGSVEITPPPADQSTVLIKRDTNRQQQTDYNAYDPFPAETHEDALDKLTLIAQEQDADVASLETLKLEWVTAPTAANDTGTAGQVAYDSAYLYVCVATDTWLRFPGETW